MSCCQGDDDGTGCTCGYRKNDKCMIAIQKLNDNPGVRFGEIPQFTFFESYGDLYYKTPSALEIIPNNSHNGPSWNAIRMKDGATRLFHNDNKVSIADVTINYKTTNTLST